ncbi:MAG: ATP-binding protein [Candidatus Coatesbacteria bacterium]|mgnify:FL=1
MTDANVLATYLKESAAAILSPAVAVSERGREFVSDLRVFPVVVLDGLTQDAFVDMPPWGYLCKTIDDFSDYVRNPKRRWQHDTRGGSLTIAEVEVERIARLLGLTRFTAKGVSFTAEMIRSQTQDIPDNYEIAHVVTGSKFFGRREELAELMGHIRNNKHVAVFGLQRIGKTSLVLEALNRIQVESAGGLLALTVNLHSIPLRRVDYSSFARDFIATLLDRLYEALGRELNLAEADTLVADFVEKYRTPVEVARALNRFFSSLAERLAGKRVIFFLDEMQSLGSADEESGDTAPQFDQFVRLLAGR